MSTPYDPERLLAQIRAALAPDSDLLEARMDRAANVDSDLVRYLRHLLGVPADRPNPSDLTRDQEHGDTRRAENPPGTDQ